MTRAIPATLLAALVLADGAPLGREATTSPAPSPDLVAMLERARRAQEADVQSWSGYRFRRIEERQKLDGSGEVVHGQRTEAIVTPIPGGFDERLITIDGRPPTDKEIAAHRDARRFARHYARMVAGEGDPAEGGYSLGFLLRMASYRHVGVEEVEGVPSHRLDFGPGASEDDSLAGRFAEAMAGTIWITVEGSHIAKATARSVSPISVAFIVLKLEDLQLEMQSAPVGDDRWLPRRIDVRTRSRIVGFPSRTRNLYEYSDFVSFTPVSE